jgi:3-hydroxyacyl-[acyl-carrier-protein] dehydratase
MRFHLIDRVDSWEPGKSVRARKLTSLSEEFWEDGAGGPVMPPPLILEALCQAGTWLVMITTDRRKRAALLSIASVEFGGPVRPGDVLLLEGECDSMSDEVAVVSGRVTIEGGQTVLEAKDIMCALIDAQDLADLEDTERLQTMLTRGAASGVEA